MTTTPFTRPTILAAVAFLDTSLSQASFNHMVLRLGLENDIPSDTTINVSKKADRLGRVVLQRPDDALDPLEGQMTLAEAVVRDIAIRADDQGRKFVILNVRGKDKWCRIEECWNWAGQPPVS